MVVVSNFEKIEDQDQGYDESDCVDLFCCAVVSISLIIRELAVDRDKPVKYNFDMGYLIAPSDTWLLPILKVIKLLINFSLIM